MTLSKAIPLGFLSIGIILLMQVILPIAYYQIWLVGQKYNGLLISPTIGRGQVLGVSVQSQDNFPIFVSTLTRTNHPNYTKFNLSIPKLNIEKAEVYVDSNDLSKGLIHLPGSALLGEKGNIFISGHSASSKLFISNKALFGNLMGLKKGDEIVVEAQGVKFKYEVLGSKVVDPKDLSVINAPESQGRYISLMTCVPPGLNFKRLVVLGKII